MYRTEVIQRVIDHVKAKSYLEIGVCGGKNFRDIKCDFKVGVDPVPPDKKNVVPYLGVENIAYYQATSNCYFEDYSNLFKFDVVFIDGLHTKEQAWKDFLNALTVLNPGGAIIFHDCNPTSEAMQRVPQAQKRWTGDVWKAWVAARSLTPQIIGCCVEGDYGLGVLIPDFDCNDEITDIKYCTTGWDALSYRGLVHNYDNWLNLVDDKYFIELLNTVKPIH
jgi:hypothetical protein